jgi:hypothetical protein
LLYILGYSQPTHPGVSVWNSRNIPPPIRIFLYSTPSRSPSRVSAYTHEAAQLYESVFIKYFSKTVDTGFNIWYNIDIRERDDNDVGNVNRNFIKDCVLAWLYDLYNVFNGI